jgi:hypothetical protein
MPENPPLVDDEEAAAWPEMIAKLVAFGLSRSTAARLVGQPHVTPDMVDRWLHYCRLRGRKSRHGSNTFLITRLIRNDISAPSWGALQRLEQRLSATQKGGFKMSAYPLKHLIRFWETERLTTVQMIGQILLHLQNLSRRLQTLERNAQVNIQRQDRTSE